VEVNSNSKWFVRSRQLWAIWGVALMGITAAARQTGFELPAGLEQSVDGVAQALFALGAAALQLWSLWRPDNAALTALPDPGNTPIAGTRVLAGAGTLGAIALLLLLPRAAGAVDPECEHLLAAPPPDQTGIVYDAGNGAIALCTPAWTALDNPIPDGLTMDECVVEIVDGPVWSAQGPFTKAELVLTPIPVVMEFDHGMRVWCSAAGVDGEVLEAIARFPFSGPGAPGQPLPSP